MQLSASVTGVHGNVSCREGPDEVFLFATGDVAFPRFAGQLAPPPRITGCGGLSQDF